MGDLAHVATLVQAQNYSALRLSSARKGQL